MGGFDVSKDRSYSTAPAPRSPEREPLSPAEQARDAFVRAERRVVDVEASAERVRQAQSNNDYGAWQAAQATLAKEIDGASRAIELARGTSEGKSAPVATNVDPLLDRLAAVTSELPQLDVAPAGYKPIEAESELLEAIVRKPTGASIRAGFEAKEAEVGALLQKLSPPDARNLRARLDKPLPGDALAAAFLAQANLTTERQARLRSVLVRVGKQVTAPDAPTAAAPQPAPPQRTTSVAPAAAPSSPAPAPAAERATTTPASTPQGASPTAKEALAVEHGGVGFARGAAPQGVELIRARLDVTALPPEMCGGGKTPLGQLSASGALILANDRLVLAVEVSGQHWIAWIDPAALIAALTGGADASKQLPLEHFVRDLARRVKQDGSRLRISLWGTAPTESFAVIELSRAVRGLGEGSFDGLRPVEAQISLGKAGGVSIFANESIKARDAIPGDPIGDWFEIADPHLAGVLATGDGQPAAGSVWAGVFYAEGVLRVAIKPSEDARTGIVAHVDLVYVLDRLRAFGAQATQWIAKLTARLHGGARDFLRVARGHMHLALPEMSGTWFEFDLPGQLSKLWRGHGFDLSGMVPTSFHLELGGVSLGAMPKLSFPWLASAKAGSFTVPWERLAKMLGGMTSLSAPKLPALAFDLHVLGDLSLGVGIDLAPAWPELGDLALGFELHLDTLLAKGQAAGQWLMSKLRGLAGAVNKWIHVGSDGVLRLYDSEHADGPMLGFQLMKLLDGVNATDLAPTELRWKPSAQLGLEMGAQAPTGQQTGQVVAGQAAPTKPAGKPTMQMHEPVPAELAAMLAIAAGSPAELAVYWSPGTQHVTLWAQAPSTLQAQPTALKVDLGYGGIVDIVSKHLPAGKARPSIPVVLKPAAGDVVTFAFGDAARPATDKTKSGVTGSIGWKLSRLVAAQDLTALEPDVIHLQADGVGGLDLGTIHPPGPAIGDAFAVAWPAARQHLFHDEGSDVWVSAHAQGDVVALAMTKTQDGDQGALAQVHVSFLLRALERLGKLGERALQALAKAGHVVLEAGGNFADKVSRVASVVGTKLLSVAEGALKLALPDGQWIHWDLQHQLPQLGLDFDWSRLIPTFQLSFELGHVGALSLSWLPQLDIKGVHLPAIELPAIRLGTLLEAVPGVDLTRVKGQLSFVIGWVANEMALDVGIDVSAIVDAFPDVLGGAGRALAFRVPMGKLLAKLEQKAAWARAQLAKGGNVASMMSLGPDGVLRIHDSGDRNVIGFHLMRLLDGVDASDLVPTELRLSSVPSLHLELGEQAAPGAKDAAGAGIDHKTAPTKPTGKPVMSTTEPAPAALAALLALKPDSQATIEVYATAGAQQITLWAQAPSTVYDRPEAVKLDIAYGGIADSIRKFVLSGKPAPSLPVVFQPGMGGMVTFAYGDAARAPGDKTPASGVSGRVGWKLATLIAAQDLSALKPELIDIGAKGVGSLLVGPIKPIGNPIGGFAVEWPAAHQQLFHDEGSQVWINGYVEGDVVGLSLTKTETGRDGAMATLSVSFLLRQLEKLGKLAEKILHAIAKSVKLPALTGSFGDKVTRIATALVGKLSPLTEGLLKLPLDAGQWIAWDLKHLPSMGLDFDWSKLIPTFNLSLDIGRAGTIALSWLPAIHVEGIQLPRIALPAARLATLLAYVPGFDASKLKGALPFAVGWVAESLAIDIGVDLSPLLAAFPDLGSLGGAIGFRVPLGALVRKLDKVATWAHQRLAKLRAPHGAIDLGADGVLRIHDEQGKNVIGFDLTRLLDGVDANDLVPVELRTEVDNKKGEAVIDLAYGETQTDNAKADDKTKAADSAKADDKPKPDAATKEPNKVVAHKPTPRPNLPMIAQVAAPAPAAIRDYFGAADGAVIDLSAYLDAQDVIVFAAMPHSDRGIEARVHYQRLASSVNDAGPIKAPHGMAVSIAKQSTRKGMLVATFGPQPKAGEKPAEGSASGHVAWKLERLISGDVYPDELHAANDKGSLTAGTTIPLAGLSKVSDFAVPGWAQGAVGASAGELWASLHGALKVAIVEAKPGKHDAARGVELDLEKPFVDQIQTRLTKLVTQAQLGIGTALGRTRGAGADPSKAPGKIHPKIDRAGVIVERGAANAPDHMYAKFGWEQLGQLATGDLSIDALLPVEFRVATKNASFEVTDEATNKGQAVPEGARQVEKLHELFRSPLNALGVKDAQWIAIHNKESRIQSVGSNGHRIQLVADLFDVDGETDHPESLKVTGGHKFTASLDLAAVLAQVMPRATKLFNKKPAATAAKKPARVSAKLEAVDDFDNTSEVDPGVKLTVHADLSTKKTNRSLDIAAGWTLEQILELVLRMGDMIDGTGEAKQGSIVGLLAPTYLAGTFMSEKFGVELGTVHDAHATQHTCPVPAVPGLAEILSEFMDPPTASASIVHVELPSTGEMALSVKNALATGQFVRVVGCAIQVPREKESRFYGATFLLSPEIMLKLASFIPELGAILKLAQAAADFLKHPGETVEALAYTPELMYQFVKHLPDIVDNLSKMSWKELAMAVVMHGDATSKTAVMAARMYDKLKSDPAVWAKVQAMKEKGSFHSMPDVSAELLQYLSEQDPAAIAKFLEMGKAIKRIGIDTPDGPVPVPSERLNADAVDARIQLIEAGYEQYARKMEAAEQDKKAGKPVDQAELDKEAKALQATVAQFTSAGAKSLTVSDPRKADSKAAPVEAPTPAADLTNVSGLPDPDPGQIAQAQTIFQGGGPGGTHRVEVDYLVKKFAALSTEQLGQLLTSGKTRVVTRNGEVELPMFENERDFVRSLFLRRIDPHAQQVAAGEATKPKLSDDELVARWKAGKIGQPGARPGTDEQTVHAGGKAKRTDATGTGSQRRGSGGGAGTGTGVGVGDEDVDDIFGDEQQLVAAAVAEGKAKKPGQGEGEDGGNTDTVDQHKGQATSSDGEQHLINVTAVEATRSVRIDNKTGKLELVPDARAFWLAQYAHGATKNTYKVHQVAVLNEGKTGAGKDAVYLFRIMWDLWSVDNDTGKEIKHHHTETTKRFEYSTKKHAIAEIHNDNPLLDALRQRLKVVNGKVIPNENESMKVKSPEVALTLVSVAHFARRDPRNTIWNVTLQVIVDSADDGYMLVNEQGAPFEAKKFLGTPVAISGFLQLDESGA
jgi:hypothetical protein